MSTSDALIVGGGPIGLAGAIALSARGLTVRVIDPRRPPIDKACGEGIMPDGVRWLEENGVELGAGESLPFHGIRYLDGDSVAEARFANGRGLGVRRTELHRALVARATDAGVTLEWGIRALGLRDQKVETRDGPREARWLVGADGLGSRVRRWAGLDGTAVKSASRLRTGLRRHYRLAPWTELVEVHWARDREAYVTPISPTETGIAILQTGRPVGFERALRGFPGLAERLGSAEVLSTDRGNGPLWRQARGVHSGRLALLGDAAGYLDAITGEGLALGFHEADALAEAVAQGELRLYGRAFRKLVAFPFALIRLLLFVERHPRVRRRMIRTLAEEPELFARLVAIHTRDRPAASLGIGGTLRLVRGLARA